MAVPAIARATAVSCKKRPPIQLPPPLQQLQRRPKSSILSSSSTLNPVDEVYERALQNVNTFDAQYDLEVSSPRHKNSNANNYTSLLQRLPFASSADNNEVGWRSRQMNITKSNPIKPYPKSPIQPIKPSSSKQYPPSFFPPYAQTGHIPQNSSSLDTILLHDTTSIERMRTAGQLARTLLNYICSPSIVQVGMTTEQINNLLHNATLQHGAYPSPLNYMGFPKSVCASINEVVCHGIPDSRPLELGDVVSFDVSCFFKGVHGDNCATVIVGDYLEEGHGDDDVKKNNCSSDISSSSSNNNNNNNASTNNSTKPATTTFNNRDWDIPPHKTQFTSDEERERIITARRLVQCALEARDEGVAACKPGGCLSDIGAAIHAVSDAYGYDTVRHYRGHGIAEEFHRAPFVKHFRNDEKMELLPGMIFTIEPMITEGNAECYEWADNWTVVTRDGGRVAQFEHTVLITEDGVEVLTLP